MTQGKRALRPSSERPSVEPGLSGEAADIDNLNKFIAEKKAAITERATALERKRAESRPQPRRAAPAEVKAPPGRPEEIEKAKVDVQLLQTQVRLTTQELASAIDQLARAELAAGLDEAKRAEVESTRKAFEKVRVQHIAYSTRLREELAKLHTLDPQSAYQAGFGGMGGGMGGMGGGMRGMGGMM